MNRTLNCYSKNPTPAPPKQTHTPSLLKRCGIVEKYLTIISIGHNLKKSIYVKSNNIWKITHEKNTVYSHFKLHHCIWSV